jgi:hypothetical protein
MEIGRYCEAIEYNVRVFRDNGRSGMSSGRDQSQNGIALVEKRPFADRSGLGGVVENHVRLNSRDSFAPRVVLGRRRT